jgi:hypothetical protein
MMGGLLTTLQAFCGGAEYGPQNRLCRTSIFDLIRFRLDIDELGIYYIYHLSLPSSFTYSQTALIFFPSIIDLRRADHWQT